MAEVAVNVIVPLGGLGSRFQKEGYVTRPKPFVPVLGKPMILWVLEHLTLGKEDKLVIVYNPSFMNIGNFMKEVVRDKYPDCALVELPGPTRGAAETVLLGLQGLEEDARKRPTMLVDGDTFYTADIVSKFREVAAGHNAVFCFHDIQEKPIYSYITMDAEDNITEVKEKVKISDWANSGCYCFRDGTQLASECEALIESNSKQESQDGIGEFYTSGVIAAMIAKKEPFRALKLEVPDIHVLGTPAQVEEFCRTWSEQPRQRFVFDLEGVLIAGIKGEPITRNIELCQRLKKQGHIIIVQSTRAPGMERKTWALLEELKVPCDDLRVGKPRGEHYITGPTSVDAVLGDLDKQIGFHATEVKAVPRPRPVQQREVKVRKPRMHPVGSLNPDSKGVTCLVKVLDITEVEVTGRGGATMKFWEATVGDETGQVVLSLTEGQKEGLAKDKVIVVRNGFVKMIKCHIRLAVDKWGKVDLETEDTVEKVGETNISATEYELVAS
mmetsp:Transcript_51521/g.149656  ORF Transcript_51521/g.149656 Transcript_51521/m.149656 type:complete len:498 (+) Transcript_51521:70-1563(+)